MYFYEDLIWGTIRAGHGFWDACPTPINEQHALPTNAAPEARLHIQFFCAC